MKDKKKELVEVLNKMIELSEPITYEEFNTVIKAKDKKKLRALEKNNNKVGLARFDTEDEGISTLSIIATITDVLADDRLAFVVEKEDKNYLPNQITGFKWFSENKDKNVQDKKDNQD